MISPIKIGRKIFGRQNRSFAGIGGQPEATPKTQESPSELGRGQVGELSHAVSRGRVQTLVAMRAAQVGTEHLKPAVMLLL